MLALIGSLAGFFSSFLPEIFHFFKDHKDKEHELKLIDRQMAAMRSKRGRGAFRDLEEIQIEASLEESKYLYSHAGLSKIKWVDALSSSVRPVVTYLFFLLYMILKIADYCSIGHMAPIWTEEDQGMFCAIIGFWFGQRAFNKRKL